MTVTINGTTGLAGANGSASTPAVQGEDANTGIFFPAADTVAVATAGAERLRVDSAGNAGLGVTPSAWLSSWRGFDVIGAALVSGGTSDGRIYANAYFDGSGHKYKGTDPASYYLQSVGNHQWFNAPSGSAGGAITFSERMKLDTGGRLTIPAQPVFLATKDDNSGQVSVGDYVFDDVSINIGSCYNSSNGRFTAPVTGTYWFTTTFQMWGIAVGSFCAFAFYRNGVHYPYGSGATGADGFRSINQKAGAQDYHTSPSLSGAIQMSAGDYVTAYVTQGTARGMQSHFSGYLMG
jgi:hypothetical protein